MNAEVLSIGSELVAGRIADTNAAFLSLELTGMGFRVRRHTVVGDSTDDIISALEQATARARVVLLTGGLGPTPDDLTRLAVAEFLGVDLTEDPEALRWIRERFAARGLAVPESNYVQARIPRGAEVIPNPLGTAAGFSVRRGECLIFCLPGVPQEMKRMFHASVEPALRGLTGRVGRTRCLHAFGLPESVVGEKLRDLMAPDRNPQVATQAGRGIITIRLAAFAQDRGSADALLDAAEEEVRRRLGEVVFGKDDMSLSHAVAEQLERTGLTLALAESCTGGEVAARLTDVPGVSRFFLEGVVAYSNAAKCRRLEVPAELIERHGAVSAQVARAMAEGMRRTSGADLALAVTGIAGPTGATPGKLVGLVYLALADSHATHCQELRLSGERNQVRDRAAKAALDLLRRHLLLAEQTAPRTARGIG